MSTTVGTNASIANKLFNAALFLEASRRPSFANIQTGAAPSLSGEARKAKGQTAAGAPIVRVTDLESSAGDEVTVDIFHQLRQKPVMGDKIIAGKGANLKYASFSLKIDQGRTLVDAGGRMSQQRTKHNLKMTAKTLLSPYYNRLADQISLVHLAGARGDHNDADWILPLASDVDFAEIMVNPVTPPTFDRHFYGGSGATSIATLDGADLFALSAVDRLRLALDEMAFPLQPIRMEGDPMAEDSPFHCLWITPRQWYDFWTSTSGSDWRALQANAFERKNNFNHPIFKGDAVMWNNILVKKQPRPIRFNAGTVVTVCTNSVDAATTTSTAAVRVERAILLGAQAMADAYGATGGAGGGYYFGMNEEVTDHGNRNEMSVAWMNGKAKIRFQGTDGRVNDHGVMVLDTAVSTT
jgi:N4-gp56 family major capsid protein